MVICPPLLAGIYLVSVLGSGSTFCISLVLSALVLIAVPYLLGLAGIRRYVKMGVVSLIAAGLLFSVVDMYYTYEVLEIEEVSSEGGELVGWVAPERGPAGSEFQFQAVYTGNSSPQVYLVLRSGGGESGIEHIAMNETDPSDLDASDGKGYHHARELSGIYSFYFVANATGYGNITTGESFGPIAASQGEVALSLVVSGLLLALLYIGFIFLIILFIYNMFRKRQPIPPEVSRSMGNDGGDEDDAHVSEGGDTD